MGGFTEIEQGQRTRLRKGQESGLLEAGRCLIVGATVQSYQGTSVGKNELRQVLAFFFLCSGFRFRKGVPCQSSLGHISATWLGREWPLD